MVRRHDEVRETDHENRKAFLGFGSRARVVERSHHLEPKPRLKRFGLFYCLMERTFSEIE